MYFPIAIFLGVMFTVFNIIVMPISLLHQVLTLFLRIFDTSTSKDTCQKFFDLYYFILMGTFYLIIALIVDPIKFVYNLYTHKEVNVFSTQASLALTMDSFNKFEEVCEEIMSEQKAF